MPRVISQSPANGCLTVAKLISDLQEAIRLGTLRPEEELYFKIPGDSELAHDYSEEITLSFEGPHLAFRAK